MGLLDVLNGMQNGPRGQKTPGQGGSGGMSPITMAILGLLAYKAIKHLGGQHQAPAGAPAQRLPDNTTNTTTANTEAGLPGGLGDMLKGGLGGLLAGGAAGSVLSGGLNDLLKQFQQAGHAETANSWVGKGENKQISVNDLSSVLNADQLETLMRQTGLSQNELLAGLSRELPGLIDQLTPQGRVPTADEFSKFS